MELDAIAVFVKVVEAGSFSEAARLLKLPRTTVSAKVAALEKRLAVRLIERTTRRVRVTDAGLEYFQHCASALREVAMGESKLIAHQARPSGVLKLTAPVDLGRLLLPQITETYLQRYPEIRVEMTLTNRVLDLLREGIDLAIRPGQLRDSSLVARRFFANALRLWAAPRYLDCAGRPARPQDLVGHRLIGHAALRQATLSNGEASLPVTVDGRVQVDDFDTLKAMLVLGAGIGWLPECLAVDAVRAGELEPVLAGWKAEAASQVYFVYPGRRYAPRKVQAFIETALDVVGGGARRN